MTLLGRCRRPIRSPQAAGDLGSRRVAAGNGVTWLAALWLLAGPPAQAAAKASAGTAGSDVSLQQWLITHRNLLFTTWAGLLVTLVLLVLWEVLFLWQRRQERQAATRPRARIPGADIPVGPQGSDDPFRTLLRDQPLSTGTPSTPSHRPLGPPLPRAATSAPVPAPEAGPSRATPSGPPQSDSVARPSPVGPPPSANAPRPFFPGSPPPPGPTDAGALPPGARVSAASPMPTDFDRTAVERGEAAPSAPMAPGGPGPVVRRRVRVGPEPGTEPEGASSMGRPKDEDAASKGPPFQRPVVPASAAGNSWSSLLKKATRGEAPVAPTVGGAPGMPGGPPVGPVGERPARPAPEAGRAAAPPPPVAPPINAAAPPVAPSPVAPSPVAPPPVAPPPVARPPVAPPPVAPLVPPPVRAGSSATRLPAPAPGPTRPAPASVKAASATPRPSVAAAATSEVVLPQGSTRQRWKVSVQAMASAAAGPLRVIAATAAQGLGEIAPLSGEAQPTAPRRGRKMKLAGGPAPVESGPFGTETVPVAPPEDADRPVLPTSPSPVMTVPPPTEAPRKLAATMPIVGPPPPPTEILGQMPRTTVPPSSGFSVPPPPAAALPPTFRPPVTPAKVEAPRPSPPGIVPRPQVLPPTAAPPPRRTPDRVISLPGREGTAPHDTEPAPAGSPPAAEKEKPSFLRNAEGDRRFLEITRSLREVRIDKQADSDEVPPEPS